MTIEIKNICCIGAGYVGGPTMSVLADKCPEIQINVVDFNTLRIEEWNSNDLSKLPIYEPGLKEIVGRCRGKNLHFTSEVNKNISIADMIFISVNTPTKTKGVGAGQASDTKWVEACARDVAKYSKGHTIVVEKSTLPVRTAEVIKTILQASESFKCIKNNSEPVTFDVLSNPEFLSEGNAVKDLEFPDRVLIGGENKKAIDTLSEIYRKWVPSKKILHTNIWSSELAKLTANAFLAQRISSINSISALCEATGADIREVSRAIGTDSRIGSKFLDSGPGFGGSCFKKDILNLVYLANYFGLPQVANFWEEVVKINKWNQNRISQLIVRKLFGTVSDKKICILGFAFKADTNDTRESAAISICKDLLDEGAYLQIHDPKVKPEQIANDLNTKVLSVEEETNSIDKDKEYKCTFYYDIQKAIQETDAILVLTEWKEYTKINWQKVSSIMRHPAWIFDTRSVLNPIEVTKYNLNVWRIGDGTL